MPSNIRINNRVVSTLQVGDVSSERAYYGSSEVFDDFNPASLFANGERGTWAKLKDADTLFQDEARNTPATDEGDPLGRVLDKSPNGFDLTQSDAAKRPEYLLDPPRLKLDGIDDNMNINFGAAFTGEVLQATPVGILHMAIKTDDGNFDLAGGTPQFTTADGEITGIICREGMFSEDELKDAKKYLENHGAGANFEGVTSMRRWFRSNTYITKLYTDGWNTSSLVDISEIFIFCESIEEFDVSHWDTSSLQLAGGFGAFRRCENLKVLDVSNWDTSALSSAREFIRDSGVEKLDLSNWITPNLTNMRQFAQGASSLQEVIMTGGTGNPFADSPCTNYTNAFSNTDLTQQSIDDILVAIESAGTSGGTFDQSGGSAPSATGEAAVTALRGRGWTVTVTGGF